MKSKEVLALLRVTRPTLTKYPFESYEYSVVFPAKKG